MGSEIEGKRQLSLIVAGCMHHACLAGLWTDSGGEKGERKGKKKRGRFLSSWMVAGVASNANKDAKSSPFFLVLVTN